MKDIPVFDTEHGVASLFLREIPYRGRAHIKIQSSLEPELLLEECIAFCRMCGAQWCDASGDPFLENYPLITALVDMTCLRTQLAPTDACLFPVTEDTVDAWVRIYNERMENVPNVAWMDSADGKAMLKKGDGYFVHRDGALLGIGRACDDRIDTVISVVPGQGETVVRTLAELLDTDVVHLLVAQTNERAVRLYERLGFLAVKEVARWYRVL